MAAALTFLLFLPGVIEQGAVFYRNATGLTQAPFMHRWALLTAAFYAVAAASYVVNVAVRLRRSTATVAPPTSVVADESPESPTRRPDSRGSRSAMGD